MNPSIDRTSLILAALLIFAVVPYFVGLGSSSLWDSNEAFYAETPREMIESGDYINPSFNYNPRFNKPPLCYWVVALFYKLFGVSEAVERLPLALGAMVLVLVAFGLGHVLHSNQAGLIAALAIATLPRFLMFSRRIIIDVYLAMFMGLTLLFFLLAEKHPHRRRLFLTLMYVSVGLGVLTKGPVAAALPAIAFLVYLAVSRSLSRVRDMMLPAGAVIVAAVVLPWYAAVYMEHGLVYIKSFLLYDNLSRYTEPVWGPRRGVLFYVPVILGDMFPWSIFLIPAAWTTARSWANERAASTKKRSGASSYSALLLIWVIVIVAFYSFSRNKEDLYILPTYPAAAALTGCFISRALVSGTGRGHYKAVQVALAVAGVLLVATGVFLLYLLQGSMRMYGLGGAQAIACSLLIGGLASSGFAVAGRRFFGVAALAGAFTTANWFFVTQTLPSFERYKPVRPLSEKVAQVASADAMVGYYRYASPSMVFYLRRPVFEYYKPEELTAAFSSGKEVFCLMTKHDYDAIKDSLPVATYILASNPVFQVKLKGILDRTDIPQVVLVTNKSEARSS